MTQPQHRGVVIWRGRPSSCKVDTFRIVLFTDKKQAGRLMVVEMLSEDATGAESWSELECAETQDEVVEQAIHDLVATLQQTNAAFEKVKSQLQPPMAKAKTEQEKFRDGILDSMDTD